MSVDARCVAPFVSSRDRAPAVSHRSTGARSFLERARALTLHSAAPKAADHGLRPCPSTCRAPGKRKKRQGRQCGSCGRRLAGSGFVGVRATPDHTAIGEAEKAVGRLSGLVHIGLSDPTIPDYDERYAAAWAGSRAAEAAFYDSAARDLREAANQRRWRPSRRSIGAGAKAAQRPPS